MNDLLERTFVLIKPDAIQRGVVDKIFTKFEDVGLKLVAARMIMATEEQARNNYPGTEEWLTKVGEKTYNMYKGNEELMKKEVGVSNKLEIGKLIYDELVKFLISAPIIISVWEGPEAVEVVRKFSGHTIPSLAAVGTIRGDYAFDNPVLAAKTKRFVTQNLLHISDSPEEAEREIANWFGDNFKYLGNYDRVDYMGLLGK